MEYLKRKGYSNRSLIECSHLIRHLLRLSLESFPSKCRSHARLSLAISNAVLGALNLIQRKNDSSLIVIIEISNKSLAFDREHTKFVLNKMYSEDKKRYTCQ